jgi:phosphatidylserine/phosphatidylglycerophosphate/cardiolipin synthase-like enzyme
MLSFAGDPSIDAVRCAGNLNAEKSAAFPRAHHKFVVFCRLLSVASQTEEDEAQTPSFEPYEAWTGSFNFTKNATYSFENAVVSRDKNFVRAFFEEACQIAALSERLDWETEWTAPEWRIGS